jgi:hypothetical protein
MEAGDICRICFEGSDFGDLCQPCLCKGSQQYIHQTCLAKWRATGSRNSRRQRQCGTCRGVYQLNLTNTANEKNIRKYCIIISICSSLIAFASAAISAWSCYGVWDDMPTARTEREHHIMMCAMVIIMISVIVNGISGCVFDRHNEHVEREFDD